VAETPRAVRGTPSGRAQQGWRLWPRIYCKEARGGWLTRSLGKELVMSPQMDTFEKIQVAPSRGIGRRSMMFVSRPPDR